MHLRRGDSVVILVLGSGFVGQPTPPTHTSSLLLREHQGVLCTAWQRLKRCGLRGEAKRRTGVPAVPGQPGTHSTSL